MTGQAETLCESCGKPFPRGGSLTQWIFDTSKCSCSNKTADAPHSPRCVLCGLPIRTKLGSITQWIFKTPVCECLTADESASMLDPGMQDTQLPVDDVIPGSPYEFLGVTGAGGIATVFKARNRKLGRLVAIKILQPGLDNERVTQNFLREAKSASKLQHPNVVCVQDFGNLKDGRQFLVTEWIEGVTLAQYLKNKGRLSIETVQELFSQVLDGLSHAHNRGVVHRDIKPSNIMLTRGTSGEWTIKIIDFGTAKELDNEGATTRAEDMAVSPLYMSPEQATGELVDSRSDLYSTGCSIFEALTGRTPFVGKSLSVVMRHQMEVPPTLTQAGDGMEFPQRLEEIVSKLLSKKPTDRYQSAEELKADLRGNFRYGRMITKTPVANNIGGNAENAIVTTVHHKGEMALVFAVVFLAATIGLVVCLLVMKETTPTSSTARQVSELQIEKSRYEIRQGVLEVVKATGHGLELMFALIRSRGEANGISEVRMNQTQLTVTAMRHLKDLGRLRRVELNEVEGLDAKTFSAIGSAAKLNYLLVQPTSDQLPPGSLAGLKDSSVTDLNLNLTFQEENFKDIAKISALKHLVLSPSFQAQWLVHLKDMPNLDQLTMGGVSIADDDAVNALSKLQKIRSISMPLARFSLESLRKMSPMPSVITVDMKNCEVGDVELRELMRIFPNARNLNLDGIKTTDAFLDDLAQQSAVKSIHLTRIKISKNSLLKFMDNHHGTDIHLGADLKEDKELKRKAQSTNCTLYFVDDYSPDWQE